MDYRRGCVPSVKSLTTTVRLRLSLLRAVEVGGRREQRQMDVSDLDTTPDFASLIASRCRDPVAAALLTNMIARWKSDTRRPHQDADDAQVHPANEREVAAARHMVRYIADTFGACPG